MVQVYKQIAKNPRQASHITASIDKVLDPEFFKSLGDPTRLLLLACLAKCGRSCTVSEVAECCHVDFSVVSRHLAVLSRAGVIESEKEGRTVSYRVRYREVSKTLKEMARAFDECRPQRLKGEYCESCQKDPSNNKENI